MKGFYRLCLLTTVISLASYAALRAEDNVVRTPYVSPAVTPEVLYRLRRIDARRLAAARAAALSQVATTEVRAPAAPVVRPVSPLVRPVSWGVRAGALSSYPAAIYGQTQSPAP